VPDELLQWGKALRQVAQAKDEEGREAQGQSLVCAVRARALLLKVLESPRQLAGLLYFYWTLSLGAHAGGSEGREQVLELWPYGADEAAPGRATLSQACVLAHEAWVQRQRPLLSDTEWATVCDKKKRAATLLRQALGHVLVEGVGAAGHVDPVRELHSLPLLEDLFQLLRVWQTQEHWDSAQWHEVHLRRQLESLLEKRLRAHWPPVALDGVLPLAGLPPARSLQAILDSHVLVRPVFLEGKDEMRQLLSVAPSVAGWEQTMGQRLVMLHWLERADSLWHSLEHKGGITAGMLARTAYRLSRLSQACRIDMRVHLRSALTLYKSFQHQGEYQEEAQVTEKLQHFMATAMALCPHLTQAAVLETGLEVVQRSREVQDVLQALRQERRAQIEEQVSRHSPITMPFTASLS
jgi:hypothetical protein